MPEQRFRSGSGHSRCVVHWSQLRYTTQTKYRDTVPSGLRTVDCVWNVMAHAQKPYFVFRRNGRVHLNRRGRQFSRLLASEVRASLLVMLDTPCSEVVWRVLAIHSIRQFPLHFPFRASPCAISFQTQSTRCLNIQCCRLQEVRTNHRDYSFILYKLHLTYK
jgi:hypothetical protein